MLTMVYELLTSKFHVKSFLRQSRSRGGGIVTIYKFNLGYDITFEIKLGFTHISFEQLQARITLDHNTQNFNICVKIHSTDVTILLTIGSPKVHFRSVA